MTAICELCGDKAQTFKREGTWLSRAYNSVCESCIRKHFSPAVIIRDLRKATGYIGPTEWTPAAVLRDMSRE